MQVEVYKSDDYAGLEAGKYEFYYGYEVTEVTSTDDEGYENESWCFQVKVKGKIVMTLTREYIEKNVKMENHLDSPEDYLNAGIGIWLLTKAE
jgi:hypothetical protein